VLWTSAAFVAAGTLIVLFSPWLPLAVAGRATQAAGGAGLNVLAIALAGSARRRRRQRAVEFKKLLTEIGKAVPDELDVHLVWDNLPPTRRRQRATRRPSTYVFTSLHPDLVLLDQSGRAMVRIPDRSADPSWCVHKSVATLEKDVRNWMTT
jgi:hypothetical protein